MTTPNALEPLKAGTVVRIKHSGYQRAQIAEYRGPLGPQGQGFQGVRMADFFWVFGKFR